MPHVGSRVEPNAAVIKLYCVDSNGRDVQPPVPLHAPLILAATGSTAPWLLVTVASL